METTSNFLHYGNNNVAHNINQGETCEVYYVYMYVDTGSEATMNIIIYAIICIHVHMHIRTNRSSQPNNYFH